MVEERAEIGRQRSKWIAAINQGDAAGFAAMVTDDAVWLPSRHDAICGKEKIRTWLEKPFTEFDYDYEVADVLLRVAGEWAIEQARFSSRARKRSGDVMPAHEGMYTLLWRKTPEGTWLIERYIDHTADFTPHR